MDATTQQADRILGWVGVALFLAGMVATTWAGALLPFHFTAAHLAAVPAPVWALGANGLALFAIGLALAFRPIRY
jgi:hypothetical protein